MIFSKEAGFTPESGLGYTDAGINRVNARFKVFMEPFKADFTNARVLDLASHDGRWTYAALKLGAAHVTGIEARPELIAKGKHIFDRDEFRGRSTFLAGDIFEVMPQLQKQGEKFDIVLCLGIFYHVMDHYRLVKLMCGFNPRMIILDSGLINDDKPYIQLRTERTDEFLNAAAGERESVVGFVSTGGVRMMARSLGYGVRFLDWIPSQFADHANLHDYFREGPDKSRRFSAVLQRA
jgi:hypothetical protein